MLSVSRTIDSKPDLGLQVNNSDAILLELVLQEAVLVHKSLLVS